MKSNNQQKLFAAAQGVQENAYAPYSNFKVGSALIADNQQMYVGTNVENVAYPEGVCAEAGAISAMIASGAHTIDEILIVSPTEEFCPPCGGCRQKIKEFAHSETKIHLSTANGHTETYRLADLLPVSFDF